MKRALTIPAALVVLVALPSVAFQGSDEPEKPPAAEAALTVNLEGNEGSSGHPYRFEVSADSGAPEDPVVLRDSTGEHTATLEPSSGCDSEPRAVFPAKADPWCLALTNVSKGHELSGTIAAAGTDTVGSRTLKLTVNRRDEFCPWPLVALIAGLLVGALVVLFKSVLRTATRQAVLGKMLKENSSAAAGTRIDGLTEFARERLAAGEEIDDLIKKVSAVRKSGPAVALAARDALRGKLSANAEALRDKALKQSGSQEAARTDHRVGDFLGADGAPVPHPATALGRAIAELVEDLAFIETLAERIAALPENLRAEPRKALVRAELVAVEAAKPKDVERVAVLLVSARDAVEAAAASAKIAGLRGEGPEAAAAELTLPTAPPPATAAELGGGELGKVSTLAMFGTAAVVVGVLVLAVITIKLASYDPKLTFSSFGDYFTLFAAGLGSAAVGSVIVVLGFWATVPPAAE